ncbi:hypothetical protein BH09MYX1_BH09MYX1_53970 [soil metagenome]
MRRFFLPFVLLASLAATSCATYSDELGRGQAAFEKNESERALATFRALEPDQHHLSTTDEARYAYLRGMTDYRIGYRADARHWLGIAKAIEAQQPKSLPSDWKSRLNDALTELNDEVFAAGRDELKNERTKDIDVDVDHPKKKSKEVE